jgi:hypothetical protein
MAPREDATVWAESQLFFVAGSTELADLLAEGARIRRRNPQIMAMIRRDRDVNALAAKQTRDDERRWHLEQTPALLDLPEPEPRVATCLDVGRPRTEDRLVFEFLLIRGYYGGGISDRQTWDLLCDSITVRALLAGDRMPGRTTILEILNCLSDATVEAIHRAILQAAADEGLDDFATIVADSTASAANSRFPTDSGLVGRLLERAIDRWTDLAEQGLPAFNPWHIARWRKNLRDQAIAIDFAKSKAKRKAAYRHFLTTADKMTTHLGGEFDRLEEDFDQHLRGLPPRAAGTLAAAWNSILQDLAAADQLRLVAWSRVIDGQEPDPDRVWSTSDPDARLIVKGGRQTVFGYRPTVVRSQHGLLTALIVERGNTADSTLVPAIIAAHESATGVHPHAASFDDGYANGPAAAQAEAAGTRISVSGAKGKRQTDPNDWDSDTYTDLRRLRPQVESDIHALKARHGWARVGRRSLPRVRRSLMEGIIAYNLLKLRRLRRDAAELAAVA